MSNIEIKKVEEYKEYLITVIDDHGYMTRRLVFSKELNNDFNSNKVLNWLKINSVLLESSECIIIENYNIFESEVVINCVTVIEVISCKLNLYVFGAGHVGRAVAFLGAIVGYKTFVLDDREEFLISFKDTSINVVNIDFNNLELKLHSNSAVVIVTRGHQFDELCLKYALKYNLKYIGMIGSRRRVAAIFKRIENLRISGDLVGKIFSPIGLEIGARTPIEIAVSILAEIIKTVNKEG